MDTPSSHAVRSRRCRSGALRRCSSRRSPCPRHPRGSSRGPDSRSSCARASTASRRSSARPRAAARPSLLSRGARPRRPAAGGLGLARASATTSPAASGARCSRRCGLAGVVPPEGPASPRSAPPVRESRRRFMPLLVNALAELAGPVVLVLDDLHVARARASAYCSWPSCSCTRRRHAAARAQHPRRPGAAAAPPARRAAGSPRSASPTWRSRRTRRAALLAAHGVTPRPDELVGSAAARAPKAGAQACGSPR